MKKLTILFFIFLGITVHSFSEGIFFDLGLKYNYEYLDSDPEINSDNVLLEFGAGYDFGSIQARIYGNYMIASLDWSFYGTRVVPADNTASLSKWKLGIETGYKIVNSGFFDLIIPIGVLFSWSGFGQTEPSYTSSRNPYDQYWDYFYVDIVSGINFTIKFEYFDILIIGSIGYPIVKEYEYKAVLRGDVIWRDTGTNTYSEKTENIDVFNFSLGAGVRINF